MAARGNPRTHPSSAWRTCVMQSVAIPCDPLRGVVGRGNPRTHAMLTFAVLTVAGLTVAGRCRARQTNEPD